MAYKGAALQGDLTIPGDKSISHRSIMLAALADGTSRINGFLEGEDARATESIFRQLGVRIEAPEPGVRIVHGVGIDGLRAPAAALDCGNAGTGMRLLAGLLAGQSFSSTLTGDASLSKRPMRRVIDPLTQMGVAWTHIAPCIDNSDNRLAHKFFATHSPLLGTLAMGKGTNVISTKPPFAAKINQIALTHPFIPPEVRPETTRS